MKHPLHEVRRGFIAPQYPISGPQEKAYEVWRRETWASAEQHLDTFLSKEIAQKVCDSLNGVKSD